jgi:ectoine hydroxylase-related dioxygenase (phytanoyl-CoA dioxygenase family)
MVSEAQRQQFREQGFFVLPNLFSAADIDALRARIDRFDAAHEAQLRQAGQQGISRPNEISFTAHLAEQDPEIMAFTRRPELIGLATSLIAPDISLYWNQSVYKRPEAKRDFPWHQDNGYTPVEPQEYLTCWLALEDATIENGCIWVLPGTHHDGIVEHKDSPIGKQCYFGDDPGIPVPLAKGSMAAFSSLLFHRSGPNTSAGTRKAYIMQYTPADARHGATGEPFNRTVVARDGRPV